MLLGFENVKINVEKMYANIQTNTYTGAAMIWKLSMSYIYVVITIK